MLRFSGPTPHRYSAIKENTNGIAKATYCYNRQSRKTLKIQTDASPSMHRPMFTVFLVCQIHRSAGLTACSVYLQDPHPNPVANPKQQTGPCPSTTQCPAAAAFSATHIKAHQLKLLLMRKFSRRRSCGEHVELRHVGRLHLHRIRACLASGRTAWTGARAFCPCISQHTSSKRLGK